MTEGLISCTIDEGVPHTSVGQLFPNTELKLIDVESQQELGYNEVLWRSIVGLFLFECYGSFIDVFFSG